MFTAVRNPLPASLLLAALLAPVGQLDAAGLAITDITFNQPTSDDRAELTGFTVGGDAAMAITPVIIPTTVPTHGANPVASNNGGSLRWFRAPNETGAITDAEGTITGLGLNSATANAQAFFVQLPIPITSSTTNTGLFVYEVKTATGTDDVDITFYDAGGSQLGGSVNLDDPVSLGSSDTPAFDVVWNDASTNSFQAHGVAYFIPSSITDLGDVHYIRFSDSNHTWDPVSIGTFEAIPEPARAALLAAGLLVAIGVRRRRA